MLGQLAEWVQGMVVGYEQERGEAADATERALHRISLHQGAFRVLDRLNLSHLRKARDTIYGKRSKLVHGLVPMPGAWYEDLVGSNVNLCGQILLIRVAQDVPTIKKQLDMFYPLSPL